VRVVPVPLGDESYDITIGPGALAALPDALTRHCPAARYAIITDSTVAGLYGDRVREAVATVGRADVFAFPAGEWNKTREQWAALSDRMAEAGIGRDGAVIALGGGVSGDLAGFVAATYRRGIPFVQVPTSLLAMVDSSVGGKTGVDTAHGKNLVGAFHQPRAVIADVATLATLSDPHLRAGLAEAIKHGAVADRGHLDRIGALRERLLGRDPEALEEVVGASVAIKVAVVAADAREHGRRAILNFGHTVAHAVESVSGYALLHGEAVAIGMGVEAALGTALGITRAGTTEALRDALAAVGLPQDPTELPREALLEAMRHDKKTRGGTVKFAFLKELGQAAQNEAGGWTFAAPDDLVQAALGV
jgi:3-dehydroquinate synthase